MEKRTGNSMVAQELKYLSISIKEIIENGYRLEAGAYNFKARLAKETLKKCKYPVVNLWSDKGLISNASYPLRFKRKYVDSLVGVPMFLPSQMVLISPKPTKFISKKYSKNIEILKVKKGMLLLSRSGTIGKTTIVNETFSNTVFSDDVIRILPKSTYDLGYIYAYLNSNFGSTILSSNKYGAVIQHIEPEHLCNVLIPNPPDEIKQKIHDLIMQSFDLRDQYNELLNRAEKIIYEELKLVPIENLKLKYFDETVDLKNYSVPLNKLDFRFDASYHLPLISEIISTLKKNAKEIRKLSSLAIDITMPGIFKRNYVEADSGVAFLGTNDILQLSPKIDKYLSIDTHKKLIEKQLSVKENTLLITDRGTIGNVILVPKYYETENWVVSQNAIRVIANNNIIGYIFIFLNSEFSKTLIKRETYGAVIDMIDSDNVAEILIPTLNNSDKQKEINDLALQANEIRTKAFEKEKEGIKLLTDLVINVN
ncbi:MAG: restriction endonuclease subunit S [Cytophagales bacterium]|nr:restriction endonuclease subunit S [Cytophagales bacterium]